MNDQEWQLYLDTLSPELSDLAQHIMTRINTVINRERNRAVGEHQELHQRSDRAQAGLADMRMIVNDLVERVRTLEGSAGDG